MRNMDQVQILEAAGIPVIPATGNNIGFAQKKLLHPVTGAKLRDLTTNPGIYCNGALVKGVGGKEIDVRALGSFTSRFVDAWLSMPPPQRGQRSVVGLGKEAADPQPQSQFSLSLGITLTPILIRSAPCC